VLLDQFDLLAVVLGIMFAVRRLDARSREPSAFPHVPAAEFLRWQSSAVRAYTLGGGASALRLVFHLSWVTAYRHGAVSELVFRRLALLVDGAWIFALVASFVLARSSRRLRERLGIQLEKSPAGS
jgi:hypothetical protein